MHIDISFIQGVMVGIEFPALMEIDPNVTFCCSLDLGIVRILLVKTKDEE